MSNNRTLVNKLYADFASGDVASVLATLDDSIKWTEAAGFPYGGTYIGPQAVAEDVFAKMSEEWEDFTVKAEKLVCEGDTVVALGSYSGTYKQTAKHFTAPFAHVWCFKDGKVISFQQYTDTVLVQAALA